MAVDAWNMAAECARAINASKDPTRRALVGTLQKLWIELGNKERLLSEQHVLKEMEDLYTLHKVFLGTNIPTTGHWAHERSLMLAGSDLPRTAQDSGLRETDREAR
jgi:hypothetical protein